MPVDLSGMSLNELKELRSTLSSAISSYDRRRASGARAAADEAAATFGFKLADLVSHKRMAKRSKSNHEPKYSNPADPSQTWTGLGRRPAWIDEGLAAGKSLEDFAVFLRTRNAIRQREGFRGDQDA